MENENGNAKSINDYFFKKDSEKDYDFALEKEFEAFKEKHIMRVCFTVRERELIEEAETGINIPTFLIRDKIKAEAVRTILELKNEGDEYLQAYYNQAWEKLAPTQR